MSKKNTAKAGITADCTASEGKSRTGSGNPSDGHRRKFCGVCFLFLICLCLGGMLMLAVTAADDLLKVESTELSVGDPIYVSAVGGGTDWVGIYYPNDEHSIRWAYVKDVGSGVTFDLWKDSRDNGSSPAVLPVGEYIIRLMPNDSTNISDALAVQSIVLRAPKDQAPKAPIDATYTITGKGSGLAAGTLTVTLPKESGATDLLPYWGDDNGKLAGYTAMAKFKVTGETTERQLPERLLIPQGATRILLYSMNVYGQLSEEAFSLPLPEGAAGKDPGRLVTEFQVVSDVHLTNGNIVSQDRRFPLMLKDVATTSPDSIGIFIVGDMADNGKRVEYEQMMRLYNAQKGLPPLFLTIGNHDLKNGSLKEQTALFLEYATLPDGSHPDGLHYDFWLNGYHFVFLGNDASQDLNTTLSTRTLKWLRETLANDRDEQRPTFLFLHQSLKNTVAGSFDGQGWNGVNAETGLRKVLKDFPEVMMFNGHSHWTLDSEGTMYVADGTLPNIFNTSSVGYLWQSYNIPGGERLEGSQGYTVRIYEKEVQVLGRDYETGEWIPNALFSVPFANAGRPQTPDPAETDPPVTDPIAPETTAPETTGAPETPGSTEAPGSTGTPDTSGTADPSGGEEKKSLAAGWIVAGAVVAVAAVAAVGTVLFLRKKKGK